MTDGTPYKHSLVKHRVEAPSCFARAKLDFMTETIAMGNRVLEEDASCLV